MADVDEEIERDEQKRANREWLRKSYPVALALLLIFFIALFVRSYYGWGPATAEGTPYLLSGGSDSYYHMRTIEYFQTNHKHLVGDYMLNYPGGATNPRPPVWDDSIAIMGMLLQPVFHNDIAVSTYTVMIMITALFGALTIFPVYYLGKELFGWKAGLLAATFMALMPGHIERSVITNADWDSFIIFLIAVSYFFYVKALKSMNQKNWVSDWRRPKSIIGGLGGCIRGNRDAILYAGMSGIAMGGVALTWQGFPSPMTIIMIFFAIQVIFNRFRKTDNSALLAVYLMSMGLALMISFPYYYSTGHIPTWWDVPFYLFIGIAFFGLIIEITRDYPWTLVMPALVIIVACAGIILLVVSPSTWQMITTAQGYLVKTKAVGTIAEAQVTDFSRLALSLGTAVFLLFVFGIAYAINKFRKSMDKTGILFAIVWGAMALYMAITQTRFVINATPVAAVFGGWMIVVTIELLNYTRIQKTYESLRGNKLTAIKKSVKIQHIAGAMFVTFIVLLPNVWYAVDAGMPYELKGKYDREVYNIYPDFMKPNQTRYDQSNPWYFGAWGYELPGKSSYWTGAYKWFANQDTDIPIPELRPAFISWWDYGFECVEQGKHPTVADNFQFGYQAAGSFITAQNESEAVAILSCRLLEGDLWRTYNANHVWKFSNPVQNVLVRHGLNITYVQDIVQNSSRYIQEVLLSPEKYGPYSSDLNYANAEYAMIRGLLAFSGTENVVSFYHDMTAATGFTIRYYAIDTRLVPFSGTNTGIFYAPAKLADKRMSGKDLTIPKDFYQIKAVGKLGGEYDIDNIPSDVQLDPQNPYKIVYQPMLYNSTFYRNFFGYSPQEAGLGSNDGLPGISGSAGQQKPMPAWNMTHFRAVYQTAYWNPYSGNDLQNHTDAWVTMNYDDAIALQKKNKGTAITDPSRAIGNGAVTIIKYYDGAIISGVVKVKDGGAVSGAYVTINDEYDIPHQCVQTDSRGRYSIIAPFGNVTLITSTGTINKLTKIGATELNRTVFHITDRQAMRVPEDRDNNGEYDYLITKDVVIKGAKLSGRAYLDTDGNKNFTSGDVAARGAIISVTNPGAAPGSQTLAATAGKDGFYEFGSLAPATYIISSEYAGHRFSNTSQTIASGESKVADVVINPGLLKGLIRHEDGKLADGAHVSVLDMTNHSVLTASTNGTGFFAVPCLLPGNFTVTASGAGSISMPLHVMIAKNSSVSINATLLESVAVTGRVISDEMKFVKNATVIFDNEANASRSIAVKTNSAGYYAVSLATGKYDASVSYYQDGIAYVSYASKEFSGSNGSLGFELARGLELNGTVWYRTPTNPIGLKLYFESLDGGWQTSLRNVNSTGYYQIYLPAGRYAIKVNQKISPEVGGYAYLNTTNLNATKTLPVILGKGIEINGTIAQNLNPDFSDPNRNASVVYMEDALVTFADKNGIGISAYTDRNGRYSVFLPPERSFSVEIKKKGYQTVRQDFAKPDMIALSPNHELKPSNITISGKVTYDGEKVGAKLFVSVLSGGFIRNSTTTSGGAYSVSVEPGNYTVKVDYSVYLEDKERLQFEGDVRLAIGDDQRTLDIVLVKRYKLNGTMSLPEPASGNRTAEIILSGASGSDGDVRNVYVQFEDGKNSTHYEIWVKPGEYDLTAKSAELMHLDRVAVFQSAVMNFTITSGVSVSGLVKDKASGTTVGNVTVSITDMKSGWSDHTRTGDGGDYSLNVIPNRIYTISVDHSALQSTDNHMRYVRYKYEEDVAVLEQKTLDITVTKSLDNTTISGYLASPKGYITENTVIKFTGWSDTTIDQTAVSDSTGKYTVSVAPGNYMVYSHGTLYGRNYVLFGNVSVKRVDGTFQVNLTYLPGHLVSGVALLDKTRAALYASVGIARSDGSRVDIKADDEGKFSVWLPAGSYTATASATATEFGMNVTYKLVMNFSVPTPPAQPLLLHLDRDKKYGVDMAWNNAEKQTIPQNSTVIYTITVRNSGNDWDSYRLSGIPSAWKFEFLGISGNKISLEPKARADVSVRITPPKDAKVSHDALSVSASSTNSSETKSVNIEIGISQTFSVKASADSSQKPEYDGNEVKYGIKVENTGNGDDSYVVSIINTDDLKKNGWTATLKYSGEVITRGNEIKNVNASAYSSASLDLLVNRTQGKSSPDAGVIIKVVSSKKGSTTTMVTVKVTCPDLTIGPGDVVAGGERVQQPKGVDWVLTGIYLVAIVIGIMAIFTVRRKRKKWKKR